MTVSTLRPDATTSVTGSVTGAASAHAALSDNSDSSYVTINGDVGETAFGGLEDLSLPTGAVIKLGASRVRIAAVGAAVNASAGATLIPGDVDPSNVVFVSWTVPTTITFASVPADIPNGDYSAPTWQMSAPFGGTFRAYELYLDVTYVAKPTLTVDSPSGTITTTNTPTVEWTGTFDSDGGTQTRYEVKVYTDAEYGAGGFDPDTSTPTATSGITSSAATEWQLDELLVDDTYRAYVRIAQTVNGALHWSAWDTADFVVDVDPPGTPTFDATADNTNGRITLTVTDNPGTASTDLIEVERSLDAGVTWDPVRTTDGDGQIIIPWVAAVGEFSDAADGTSHALVLPAPAGGILVGDLLIAVVALDGNPTLSWPSDWTEIKDEAGNGSAVRVGVAWKRAAGGESGTITLTSSASEGGGARIHCVRGAHPTTAPEVSTGVSGSGANADPDALNPANWGTEPTLWIAAVGNDGNVAVTAGPSGYYEFGNTRWANASGAGIATAARLASTASENPGTFTHTAEDTRAFTIGVRGANASLVIYDYEAPNGTATQYRARTVHDYSGVTAFSVWATDTETWTSTSWWLKHPNKPELNTQIVARSLPTRSRAGRQAVLQPLGATSAVVVSDTRGPATGTAVLRSLTLAAQDDLDALLDEVATLMLQSPAGQGGPDYIRVGNHERSRIVDLRADASAVWETLEYVAVPSPTGDVDAWP